MTEKANVFIPENRYLFDTCQRYEKRNGGYSRVIRAGYRFGDDAPMAVIELIDRDIQAKKVDVKSKEQEKKSKEPKAKKVDPEKKAKSKK